MKRTIVSAADLVKLHSVFKYTGGKTTASILLWLLGIQKLNMVYSRCYTNNSSEFVDRIFEDLKLQYSIDENDLKKIPKSGSFILIANHPFGGAEAIITLKLIKEIRPDFKYMANFMLDQIEPLKPYFIAVNPFETMKNLRSNITGLKLASKHIEEGKALGIFPAGEVSTYQKAEHKIADKEWPRSIMKFIKSQKVVIVPMFFEGQNSRFFHFLGKIHPLLRTIKLPSELLNKRKNIVNIKIGFPISVEKQDEIKNIECFSKYLRENTYGLVNEK